MMESNSIMNSADVEMQKVVVADLIRLSPDERDVLNQFDLATCDQRIQELVNFIKCPTREILIPDVLCQLTLLYQQKSQLEAKRYSQLQTDHQMALQRENAAKLELSKAEDIICFVKFGFRIWLCFCFMFFLVSVSLCSRVSVFAAATFCSVCQLSLFGSPAQTNLSPSSTWFTFHIYTPVQLFLAKTFSNQVLFFFDHAMPVLPARLFYSCLLFRVRFCY
ncbi:hypothetical protein AMECASPLE_021633 [Ameca splendens]|uniref:Uncharacterized protein n=1 Tax=Ameca splendens TaxID=208324 RepID=A0ABV0YEQ3_9TELE